MVRCSKCGRAMVRADLYEPEGTIPLYGGIFDEKYWWICHELGCDDGTRNRNSVKNSV